MRIEQRVRKAEALLRVGEPEYEPPVIVLVPREGTGPVIAEPVEEWLTYRQQRARQRPSGLLADPIILDAATEHEARRVANSREGRAV